MASSVSHPEWNQETSGLEVARHLAAHIRGKTVLITGVSPESIGASTALAIASQDPTLLILASRTELKLQKVVQSIKTTYPNVNVSVVLLDLMDQGNVRLAAKEILSLTDRLDVIINNAGIMTQKRQWTKEGIEGQFGANHVGHFLLTTLLQPQLLRGARSNTNGATRVINITSLGHRISPVRFSDYNLEKTVVPDDEMHKVLPPTMSKNTDDGYNGWVAYGQSKTANILFSLGIRERWGQDGIMSFAVHPGSIWTGLVRNLDTEGETVIKGTSPFWKNLDQGSSTTLVAAFDPALNTTEALLLHNCQVFEAALYATSRAYAEKLWTLSNSLVI